jgi:hypothetical protein
VFRFSHAGGGDWRECAERCADRLGRAGGGLGFVYFTDALVGEARAIVDLLRERTGVADWVGTVGTGIVATGSEYQDQPSPRWWPTSLPTRTRCSRAGRR